MLSDRQLRRFFRRKAAGGRSLLSRVLDAALLRLIVFFGLYLLFRTLGYPIRFALLIALIALLFLCVLLYLGRQAAQTRLIPREMARLSRELLRTRLMLLDEARFARLCRDAAHAAHAPDGMRPDAPIALQRVEPVGADTLLLLIRGAHGGALTVCSTSGFSPAAEAFAAQTRCPLTLIGTDALLDAAMRDETLAPTPGELHAAIEAEIRFRVRRRKRLQSLPFFQGSCKKYLVAALVLLLFSLLTRYTLYYRMLAALCAAIAVTRFAIDRGMHAAPPG